MPLDSDVANADSQLHVEFYEYKGEGPFSGKPFVRIVVPGDKTNIIDQPVKEDHKKRFPRQWWHFQAASTESEVVGTPLAVWNRERPEELSMGQLTELTILKFLTVDQIAMASDAQLQRVGMGASGLRERARSYLAGKNAAASGSKLADMEAKIAQLTAMLEAKNGDAAPKTDEATSEEAPAPKKRGMPKGGWPKN